MGRAGGWSGRGPGRSPDASSRAPGSQGPRRGRPGGAERRSKSTLLLVLLAGGVVASLGMLCEGGGSLLPLPGSRPGLRDAERVGAMSVPGGIYKAAGGGFLHHRRDLALDTRLGTFGIGAVWNSAGAGWLWSFEMRYAQGIFVDASGAVHDVSGLGDGRPIPGTVWVRDDADTIETRGGLAHEFRADGRLGVVRWAYKDPGNGVAPLPGSYLALRYAVRGAGTVPVEIGQCSALLDWRAAVEAGYQPGECDVLFSLDWDAAGEHLLEVADRAGRQAKFGYDARGRLISARDGLDLAQGWSGFAYEYADDGSDLLRAIVNSEGERLEYGWVRLRGMAYLASVVRVGGNAPRWEMAHGNHGAPDAPFQSAVRLRDSTGVVALRGFEWDALYQVSRVHGAGRDAAVQQISWVDSRPSRVVDQSGVRTDLTWSDDRLVGLTLPSGRAIVFVHDPDALNRSAPTEPALLGMWDAQGVIETRTYDAFGQLSSRTDAVGETIRVSHVDWCGSVWEAPQRVDDPAGRRILFRLHGEHGHPTWSHASTRHSEPLPVEGCAYEPTQSTIDYDLVGNRLTPELQSDSGGIVRREFDEDRNVMALVTQPLVATSQGASLGAPVTTRRRWRSDGRPLRVERPYGGVTEFVYDALGRMVLQREKVSRGVAPEQRWEEVQLEYDAADRLVARILANGMETRWRYDTGGRLVEHSHLRDRQLESFATFDWTGDRLASVYDSVTQGAETYTYDTSGRLVTVVHTGGEWTSLAYDLRGRVSHRRFFRPNGTLLREIEEHFDGKGQVLALLDQGVELWRRQPAGAGGQDLVLANGWRIETRPGPRLGMPDALVARGQVGGASHTIRSQMLDDFQEYGSTSGWIEVTDYFAWDDLTGGLVGYACASQSFGYHPVGPSPGAARHRVVAALYECPMLPGQDSGPRLHVYDYDASNNITRVADEEGGVRDYVFNAERNRLLEVRDAAGAPVVEYAYDEAGFATQRNDVTIAWDAAGRIRALGSAGSLGTYVWSTRGSLLQARGAGVGSLSPRFGGVVRGNALAEFATLVVGDVQIDLTSAARLHFIRDRRNNVAFALDESGQVVATRSTSPYAGELRESGSAIASGFAGGLPIAEGLQVLGARVYDPVARRFLSPDPIFHPLNQYAYTMGNPVDFWDPSGMLTGYQAGQVGILVVTGSAIVLGTAALWPVVALGFSLQTTATVVTFTGFFTVVVPVTLYGIFGQPADASSTVPGLPPGVDAADRPVGPPIVPSPGGGSGGKEPGASPRQPETLSVLSDTGCTPGFSPGGEGEVESLLLVVMTQVVLVGWLLRLRRHG